MKYIIKFFVSGIFCSLLFPPFFLYPLGFIIFPFFYFILIERKFKKLSKFKQFLNGFFFGFGLNLIVLYWLREPFSFNVSTTNFSFLAFLLSFETLLNVPWDLWCHHIFLVRNALRHVSNLGNLCKI